MGKMSSSIPLSIIISFLIMTICSQSKNNKVTFDCVPSEKKALMRFKASLSDDPSNNMLSSWKNNSECCSWAGVECDNATGHVVGLHFGDFYGLRVDDISWVGTLSSLEYLDMSGVDLSGTRDIIKVLTLLPSLVDLRLSSTGLSDTNLPYTNCLNSTLLFNNVQHLDLSINSLGEKSSFCFLHNMTSLSFLDLTANSLHQKADWISDFLRDKCHLKLLNLDDNQFYGDILGAFKNISGCWGRNLESLDFSSNEFYGHLPEELGELKQLTELDVGGNKLSGPIPSSLGKLRALTELSLSSNQLDGEIPFSLGQLVNLKKVDISRNKLSGHIPSSLGNLRVLRSLDLYLNQLGGEIPISFGQLSNLKWIDMHDNDLEGTLSDAHFSKLSRLEDLNIGRNYKLKFHAGDDWVPPFQLYTLRMGHSKIEGQFPQWLQTQKTLQILVLRNCNIMGTLPAWLGSLILMNLTWLDLSNNHIQGMLPAWQYCSLKNPTCLDLSKNNIQAQTPIQELPSNLTSLDHSNNMITSYVISSSTPTPGKHQGRTERIYRQGVYHLDLSNNHIEGPIPSNIGHMMPLLEDLYLNKNFINGSIPESLCQMKYLRIMDLYNNHLSGHLPDCNWGNFQYLKFAILSSNHLSGPIPNSIGGAYLLRWLQLNNNNFTGRIPFTLKNCTSLSVLDVGDNQLIGKLPEGIGNHLLDLGVLRLRNNKFDGDIPFSYCKLSRLQIMDLAQNQLTGYIPHCLGNLSGMINAPGFDDGDIGDSSLSEMMKGVLLDYLDSTLQYLVNLDLSSNRLFGDIPSVLTNLTDLNGLNLSHNHLGGKIQENIGDLKSLESLDLSDNSLSGKIPQSLSKLTFLSHLNLSNNDLSGLIPTGHQLQTFNDPSIYMGNPRLCGDPLMKKCHIINNEVPVRSQKVETDDGGIKDKIYLCAFITSGVATGFWGYFGVLFFKRSWRLVLFRHMDTLVGKMLGRY